MDELKVIMKKMENQGKKPWQFDVRQYILDSVFSCQDTISAHIDKVRGEKKREAKRNSLNKDKEAYYSSNNMLVQTAIGKKWAAFFDYDYDASCFANAVYNMAFFEGKGEIKHSHGYEYVLVVDGVKYRGDTMNSWSTTVNEFIRVYGKKYVRDWSGRYIPQGCNSWEEFLGNPDNYKSELPAYIKHFMEVVYTIGNFIPMPFNSERTARTKDYWDLTLFRIYKWYMATGDEQTQNDELHNLLLDKEDVIKRCKDWLTSFRTWQDFVDKNFLQDFVNIANGIYGCPKELWPGHFSGPLLPVTKVQMEAFCTNASSQILARGNRMIIRLKEKFEEERKK